MVNGVGQLIDFRPAERRVVDPQNDAREFLIFARLIETSDDV